MGKQHLLFNKNVENERCDSQGVGLGNRQAVLADPCNVECRIPSHFRNATWGKGKRTIRDGRPLSRPPGGRGRSPDKGTAVQSCRESEGCTARLPQFADPHLLAHYSQGLELNCRVGCCCCSLISTQAVVLRQCKATCERRSDTTAARSDVQASAWPVPPVHMLGVPNYKQLARRAPASNHLFPTGDATVTRPVSFIIIAALIRPVAAPSYRWGKRVQQRAFACCVMAWAAVASCNSI